MIGLGSTIQEDIAKGLSEAVMSSDNAGGAGSKIFAQGLDIFVRETEGGKEVVNKIGLYAAVPYLVAGFALGWAISSSRK
jgi:hypothetical protein